MSQAMTRRAHPGWRRVDHLLKSAKGIFYDGCHKLYILMDWGLVDEYKDAPGLRVLNGTEPDRLSTLDEMKAQFKTSCPLRFVNAVSHDKNGVEAYEQVIEQYFPKEKN